MVEDFDYGAGYRMAGMQLSYDKLLSDYKDVCNENVKLKALLQEILPDLESRVEGLREAWNGSEILTALNRNYGFVKKIKETINNE